MPKFLKKGFFFCLAIVTLITLLNFFTIFSSLKYLKPSNQVESVQAALILGARVYESGQLSPMFEDRILTALELYREGKVEKLLISGDHGQISYDEVNVAKEYLLNAGIPAEDIFLDHAGFDTYDSLVRAKEVFQADSLIIVTQNFHLPRAVYIGKALDMQIAGVSADRRPYRGILYNHLREFPARLKSFAETLTKRSPRFLGDPIPITGDGQMSWD